jgi:hypothetical protein
VRCGSACAFFLVRFPPACVLKNTGTESRASVGKAPPPTTSHQWQHRAASALFLVPVPDDVPFPCTTEHA